MTAIGLMLMAKVDLVLLDGARSRLGDAAAPILDAFSRPAATIAEVVEESQHLMDLRAENVRLREENAVLTRYREVAHRLDEENRSLSRLLNFFPQRSARLSDSPGHRR